MSNLENVTPAVAVASRMPEGQLRCWLNKNSAAYWLGKATNDSLQRVYGVNSKMLMNSGSAFKNDEFTKL